MRRKLLHIALLLSFLLLFKSGVAFAQTRVVAEVPLPNARQLTIGEQREVSVVQGVLGGRWTRNYFNYKRSSVFSKESFAQYLDDVFKNKIKAYGLTIGIVVPSVIGLSAFGLTKIIKAKHDWIAEHQTYVPCGQGEDDDGTEWCLFEPSDGAYDGDGYNAAIGLVAGISSLATIAVLSVGIWQISKRSKQRRQLQPLLHWDEGLSMSVRIGLYGIDLNGSF